MLEEDRFCEVVAAAGLDKEDHRAQFSRSLRLEESDLREMTSESSPYFADTSEANFESPVARFFQALQLSLQLEPGRAKIPNYMKARELLLELETAEPNNAAYPFFRLRVEQALGTDDEDLHPLIEKIRTATEFNSHAIDVWRLVRERMNANASKYFVGISYVSTLPMPEYAEAIRIVKEQDAYVPGVRENLGNLMIHGGLTATISSQRGGYLSLEYSLGRTLVPWTDVLNYIDLDRKLNGSAPETDFSMTFKALLDDDGHNRKCDESSKIDFYAAIREIN